MTAEQIMARAAAVYAGCRTYADRGVNRTEFLQPDGTLSHVSTTPFTTAFVRPDRFRFEFTSHRPHFTHIRHRYLIAADGPAVQTWWDIRPGVERPESLDLALGAAAGVSGGTAHTVPALLMPRWAGGGLGIGRQVARLDDADMGGVRCYRVERRRAPDPERDERELKDLQRHLDQLAAERGVPARKRSKTVDSPEVFWFDAGTFTIRRIEERTGFQTFRTESVTTYEPVLDGPVTDDRLAFDPPAAGG